MLSDEGFGIAEPICQDDRPSVLSQDVAVIPPRGMDGLDEETENERSVGSHFEPPSGAPALGQIGGHKENSRRLSVRGSNRLAARSLIPQSARLEGRDTIAAVLTVACA